MRLIRTASSPSLISISAMPDSSSSSISFLIFRMSMPGMPPKRCSIAIESGWLCAAAEAADSCLHGQLVPVGTQPGDQAGRDVREVRVMTERLAALQVREVNLDERDLHGEQGVAQRDTGVREGAGIDYDIGDALACRGMDAANELVLGIALEGDQLVPRRARHLGRPLLDRGQRVGAIKPRLPASEQVEIGAVQQQQFHKRPRM